MAEHSIALTDTQEIALAYATEELNATRDSNNFLTVDEVLQQRVGSDLKSVLNNLDAIIDPVMSNLLAVSQETLDAILATIESQATVDRINQRLT